MMRIVFAATKIAKSTSTTATISAAMVPPWSVRHERGGAPDLYDLDALPGLDDLVVVVRSGRPDLALEPDRAGVLVVGDALEHHTQPSGHGRRARAQRGCT